MLRIVVKRHASSKDVLGVITQESGQNMAIATSDAALQKAFDGPQVGFHTMCYRDDIEADGFGVVPRGRPEAMALLRREIVDRLGYWASSMEDSEA